jgi:hypothetical protein
MALLRWLVIFWRHTIFLAIPTSFDYIFLLFGSLSGRASSHLEYAQMLVIDQVDLIDLPIVGPLQAYEAALLGACIAALHWRVLMEGLRLN